MRAAVIVFPGSNCDRDVAVCLRQICNTQPIMVWHGEHTLPPCDLIVLPGGFSYGDYLRCGAMAANSPIMAEVVKAAKSGVATLGICNGFQMLTECGLLSGVLMRNQALHFVCRNVRLQVQQTDTPFTHLYEKDKEIVIPVAHNDGNYFADADTLQSLKDNGQIIFTYGEGDNPNGSQLDIAGVCDKSRRIVGMMPHPERRAEAALGGDDGLRLFAGLLEAVA
ncbi:MAG: phosphoribosylformylglycinamidine synthase subunit PurQ [Alphaproteobacteria bacterium]|nr:phosphoribosylformylglycinamidine synthase subunit PurQ [Alphaproteobacteria bacterium]